MARARRESAAATGQRGRRSPVRIYAGIAFALAGFTAIGVAWDGASRLDFIQGQFPFFISGGLTGIGLIFVGVTILLIDTMRRDSEERAAQLGRLTETVEALNARLSPTDRYDPTASGEFRPRPRSSTNGRPERDDTGQLPPAGERSWDAGA